MNLEAFFKMSYGIYLITSKRGGELSGYIANTAFQVTSEPPKIAISCHKNNISTHIIEESGVFNLSVLEKDTDAGLIGLFGYQSGHEDEKFERVDYKLGNNGAPVILSHSIAYFECKVVDKFDVGSHYLFIGEVTDGELLAREKDPLTYSYFRNEMKLMAPERAPTYVDKNKLKKFQDENQQEEQNKVEVSEANKKDLGDKYICTICAFVYDPEVGDEAMGIPPGTPFEDLPEDYTCPICAAAKSMFISDN
ncbi:MAG: flavin reductase [Bacteroidales bacterium]|nr:flavin reductase [Bacteroidales bacterium]